MAEKIKNDKAYEESLRIGTRKRNIDNVSNKDS